MGALESLIEIRYDITTCAARADAENAGAGVRTCPCERTTAALRDAGAAMRSAG